MTNDKYHQEGGAVIKSTKTSKPSIQAGDIHKSAKNSEAEDSDPAANVPGGMSCLKKAPSKSEIADQIGLHLRSVYDDVLAQPVPGRFLELLRQLESASEARLNKDAM